MAVEVLKKLWKNEYFQTAITVALLFLIVLGLYYGAQTALGTPYPALAVASDSMFPTLNIGDLIIVQKIDPAQINADPKGLTGDILVYKKVYRKITAHGEELIEELIVHRAVKVENINGQIRITTRSDKYGFDDSPWNSTQLVGKVIARIPFIGHLPLFFHSQENIYILFLAFLIILIVLLLPFDSDKEAKPTEKKPETIEERERFKINLNHVFYVIINIILVSLTIFSLWGQYTFWQPGAGTARQGEWVTVYGMFADVQFHKKFGEAQLSQNFLTYKIDCGLSAGIRLGVPTFAWYQFFMIVLILFNVWKIYGFWKEWKAGKGTLTTIAEASI